MTAVLCLLPLIIVTTEKNGKVQHTVHRALEHDPKPIVGRKFGKLGVVLAVRPMEGKPSSELHAARRAAGFETVADKKGN